MQSVTLFILLLFFGFIAGCLVGLFGGGGGFYFVPVLSFVFQVQTQAAVATSLAAIIPTTISASISPFIQRCFRPCRSPAAGPVRLDPGLFSLFGSRSRGFLGADLAGPCQGKHPGEGLRSCFYFTDTGFWGIDDLAMTTPYT
jgi:uncharacterized membrane protein YfcA